MSDQRLVIHAPHLGPKDRPPAPLVQVTIKVERKLLPAEPTAAEMASNFAGAMERWAAAGFPHVTREQYDERSAICEPCEFWDGAARLGLGKCKAPGCGCTSLKRWLATEKCKHPDGSKWPTIFNPSKPT